jgi:hypothetical protein
LCQCFVALIRDVIHGLRKGGALAAAEKLIGTVILRSQQAVLSGAKEESRIVVKTLGARSFAAAQDDSIEAFFRRLQSP